MAPVARSHLQTAELTGYSRRRRARRAVRRLVAGYGFGGFFGGGVSAIAVGMAIAIRRRDCYRLACVGEIGWRGFGDVRDRADLNDCRLGLFENELFVDGANFSLFFESLLAASAIFFRGSLRNVVFKVADASGVI